MSRPTSRPPFSALICSILFTSDLPSRRRRVNTKKGAPPHWEEGHLCLSESPASDSQITRTSRLKRRARSLARCGPRKLPQNQRLRSAPCLLAGSTWRKNQQRRVRCSIRRRRHVAFQQSSCRRRPPMPRPPPCPSLNRNPSPRDGPARTGRNRVPPSYL